MTDATSLNLSPSPLAALTSTGAAGVVAQGVGAVTQRTGEDPAGGFQAMLTAQAGGAYDPAPSAQPVAATNLGQTAPLNAPLTNAALPNATLPAQGAHLAATPAPTATTMAAISAKSALPIMAGASLNGNLPLSGKILPVAEEDAATSPEAAAMAMPSPAMEGAKSLAAKRISPAARPRKNAEAELQQDDPQAALDKTSADKGEDAADAAAVPAAASDTLAPEMMAMATPQPAVPPREPEARKPTPSDAAFSESAFSGPVSSGPVSSGPVSSGPVSSGPVSSDNASLRPAAALAGEAAQLSLQPVATQSTAPANQVAGTGADKSNAPAAIMQPGILPWPGQPQVPAESAPAQAAQPAPMRMADAAVPLSPKVLGPKAGATKADKAATLPDATLSATANSPALTSATPQDASPLLRDALAPLASSSLPDGSAAGNALDRNSIAAPAEGAASRDMGALVDRLVEARAAMRSGSSTQWVRTSVQHAEFGRVALQIRQDGDQLSVAMASQDPGFAPAAQAALHASQSLLQPAPASQGSADTPPDQRSPDQRSGQQAQGNGNTPFGQPSSGGQPGGQDRQSPFRQQAPALADNQRTPQPAPTTARNAASAPSGRSGILA